MGRRQAEGQQTTECESVILHLISSKLFIKDNLLTVFEKRNIMKVSQYFSNLLLIICFCNFITEITTGNFFL